MKLDVEKYLPYLSDFDLPHEQKEQIIRAVWDFMGDRVDIAFGLQAVQLCGKPAKTRSVSAGSSLESGNITTASQFSEAAANDNELKEGAEHDKRKTA